MRSRFSEIQINSHLKLVLAIFVYFNKRKQLKNYEKLFILPQKLLSSDIQFFVFPSTQHFSPESY